MKAYKRLIKQNADWAESRIKENPEFFENLARLQTPKFLWIGCSDSRVPANEITNTQPGEIFVHRNIANMVVNTDLNMLSVLQYAVEVLKVEHVIVCGHYGCGGVEAAMSHKDLGLINKWLRNIKDVYRIHEKELGAIADRTEMLRRLTELNVIEQVNDLAKTSIVQRAWHARKAPHLHGWVYGLSTGKVKELINMEGGSEINPLYTFDYSGL